MKVSGIMKHNDNIQQQRIFKQIYVLKRKRKQMYVIYLWTVAKTTSKKKKPEQASGVRMMKLFKYVSMEEKLFNFLL